MVDRVYKKGLPALRNDLESVEKKMLQMVIPENIVALAVIAFIVYAANPF